MPGRAVVVCSAPRTGSGLLCSALWSTGVCGRPDEYLNRGTAATYSARWGCSSDSDYRSRALEYGTTQNGVFGIKVHWSDLAASTWLHVEHPDPFGVLAPRVDYCWVRRRDKARQAVSLYLARQTGRFTKRDGDDGGGPKQTVRYRRDRIAANVAQAEMWDREWQAFFARLGIEPATVWYEDDLEHGYESTTLALLASLGIEAPAGVQVTTELHKQADAASEQLVQRFLDEVR
jgi:LPS sulfotransferase NodH